MVEKADGWKEEADENAELVISTNRGLCGK